MLCGRAPFTGANQIELLKNIETKEYRIPDGVHISEDADHLLRGLLQRNPLLRMSFEEFFSHAYLKEYEEEKEHTKEDSKDEEEEKETCVLPSIRKESVSNRTQNRLNVSSEYVIVPGTIRQKQKVHTEDVIIKRVREIIVCRHFMAVSTTSMTSSDRKDDRSTICTTTYNNVKRQLVLEFGTEFVEKHKTAIQAVLQSCVGGVLSSVEIRRQTSMAVFDLAVETKKSDPAGATLLCLRSLDILHRAFVCLETYVNSRDVETSRNLIRSNFQDVMVEARACRKAVRVSSGSIHRTDCVEAHLWYVE